MGQTITHPPMLVASGFEVVDRLVVRIKCGDPETVVVGCLRQIESELKPEKGGLHKFTKLVQLLSRCVRAERQESQPGIAD